MAISSVRFNLMNTMWNEWRNISELRECQLDNLKKSCRWDCTRNETFSMSSKEETFYDEISLNNWWRYFNMLWNVFSLSLGISHSLGVTKDPLYDVKNQIKYYSILQSHSFFTTTITFNIMKLSIMTLYMMLTIPTLSMREFIVTINVTILSMFAISINTTMTFYTMPLGRMTLSVRNPLWNSTNRIVLADM